jgi:hypothetical protein
MIICGLFGQPFADYKGLFLFGFLGSICYQPKFSSHLTAGKAGELKLCSFQ